MDVMKEGLVKKEPITQKTPVKETPTGCKTKATKESADADGRKGKFTFKY